MTTTKSAEMKEQLWRATNDLPVCFGRILNALNEFKIKSEIHYEAEPDTEDEDNYPSSDADADNANSDEEEEEEETEPEPEPELLREVHFTMKKMSDGTLYLEMDYSNRFNSISLSSTVSGDHEIVKLDSSGIQDSTIDPGWI